MLKLEGKSLMRNRYLHSLKVFLHKLNTKEKFTGKKPGGHHFNQVIKVTTIANDTNQHYVPPDMKHFKEHSIIYVVFLE